MIRKDEMLFFGSMALVRHEATSWFIRVSAMIQRQLPAWLMDINSQTRDRFIHGISLVAKIQ